MARDVGPLGAGIYMKTRLLSLDCLEMVEFSLTLYLEWMDSDLS